MSRGDATTTITADLNEEETLMLEFYVPDLSANPDSPFVRDRSNKLVRRGYWSDMTDLSLVIALTQGVGANRTNREKRAHLIDLRREHLISQI